MNKLSHIDQHGNAQMVDVSQKNVSKREACAQASVIFPIDVYAALKQQGFTSKKGGIKDTAHIAAIMACKKTSDLIPMCHPLPIEGCKIRFEEDDANSALHIFVTVKVTHKTGVEMEALTGASVAALTIYDMCKALSHDIQIANVSLLSKTGGKSNFSHQAQPKAPSTIISNEESPEITIQLKYFASIAHAAKKDSETLTVKAATAKDVWIAVQEKYQMDDLSKHLRVAINDEFCSWDSPVKNNDLVVFIPPVSGG